jgi:putative spermidine/putrescine transport system permease protein
MSLSQPIGARAPEAFESLQAAGKSKRRRRGFGSPIAWFIFLLGAIYFLVPLYATFEFSMRAEPAFAAYTNSFGDPAFLESLAFSFLIAVLTIVVSLALIIPTAFWVRLRLPRMRPVVEFITLVPFVIPPVILVFGLLRIYSRQPVQLTASDLGSNVLLVGAYVILSFPYMYRAVDTGLATMDIRSLTEAAQSLGAGWPRIIVRIILPGLRTALLSGAFLTLAIVIGEFTVAQFLARDTFGPYLSLIGRNKAYEPAAVSLVTFALTWLAMGMIAVVGRSQRGRAPGAGAR